MHKVQGNESSMDDATAIINKHSTECEDQLSPANYSQTSHWTGRGQLIPHVQMVCFFLAIRYGVGI